MSLIYDDKDYYKWPAIEIDQLILAHLMSGEKVIGKYKPNCLHDVLRVEFVLNKASNQIGLRLTHLFEPVSNSLVNVSWDKISYFTTGVPPEVERAYTQCLSGLVMPTPKDTQIINSGTIPKPK